MAECLSCYGWVFGSARLDCLMMAAAMAECLEELTSNQVVSCSYRFKIVDSFFRWADPFESYHISNLTRWGFSWCYTLWHFNMYIFHFPVLLYPPDKPHGDISKKIRPPDMVQLLSSHFADPPKRPKTPIEVKHKDKVRRSKSGKLLIDTRHQYLTGASIAPYGYKMNLSTGRAVIKRKVDCWMTFEEYERLTK